MGAPVDCNSGYFTEVINRTGAAAEKELWMWNVVVLLDVMTFHKGNIWGHVSEQIVGSVDYGTVIPKVSTEAATEALVLMIVGMASVQSQII